MILHFQHHKEERNFSVRPVTGHYTDCNIYIPIKRFKYSPYSEGEYKNYPYLLEYKGNIQELVTKVNNLCNQKVMVYNTQEGELRLIACFPEVLSELPLNMPIYFSTNPARLVENLVID